MTKIILLLFLIAIYVRSESQPNIVFILTDDLDKTLSEDKIALKKTHKLIAGDG